ncbi:MAG: 3-isopropylmalate dehydratase [Alphaproteobacteria bacterium]|nr:3-isopropylmalate dehydratase [Alphaproteobacteria bacterium]
MTDRPSRAWAFGDNIDTDVLAPGRLMKLSPEELARHCLEAVNPEFAQSVRPGDIVVAGRNFGLGSSREQAAVSLRILGVKAVLAKSFARIFFRNAINLGLPAIVFDETDAVSDGDEVELDRRRQRLLNRSRNASFELPPQAPAIAQILDAGGLVPLLERRLKREA